KEQVKRFRGHYANIGNVLDPNEKFLFFVWFGANDLYTADSPSHRMTRVAEVVGQELRDEVANIVGPNNATFVMMNIGVPLSAMRYQKMLKDAKRKEQHKETSARLASLSPSGPRLVTAATSPWRAHQQDKARDKADKAKRNYDRAEAYVKDLTDGA